MSKEILALDLPNIYDSIRDWDQISLRKLVLEAAKEAMQLNETQSHPERLDHLLNVIVQALLYKGEKILNDIDSLPKEDKQVIFDEWNRKTKEFVRHIRMPHDFDKILIESSPSIHWDWVVISAQSFAGTNPSIEMTPEYAEERRIEAFDLMMRILAHILNN